MSRTRRIGTWVQVLLSVLAFGYILWRLQQFHNWEVFGRQLQQNTGGLVLLLLLQVLLAALNIALESLKWQQLKGGLLHQSFGSTLRQVLKGLQSGLVTPARAGDPFMKAWLLPRGLRTQAFLRSLAGSFLQNMVLMAGGFVALLWLQSGGLPQTLADFGRELLRWTTLALVLVLVLVLLLVAFWPRLRTRPQWRQQVQALAQLGRERLLKVMALTLLRYATYHLQLWLILHHLGVLQHWSDLALVMLYYAALTLLPTMALTDLGIRGSIALFLFGLRSANSPAIVGAIFLIWCLNLALPALLSAVLPPRRPPE